VKRKLDSVDSDHVALCISFELSNQKLLFIKRTSFQVLDPTTAANPTNDELLQLFFAL
jgi:hypothetical protein